MRWEYTKQKKPPANADGFRVGGDKRDRTADLLHAIFPI